jgi:hypothetical protein
MREGRAALGRRGFAHFLLSKVTAGISGILQGEGLHADD